MKTERYLELTRSQRNCALVRVILLISCAIIPICSRAANPPLQQWQDVKWHTGGGWVAGSEADPRSVYLQWEGLQFSDDFANIRDGAAVFDVSNPPANWTWLGGLIGPNQLVLNSTLIFRWSEHTDPPIWRLPNVGFGIADGVTIHCWLPDDNCSAKLVFDPPGVRADGESRSHALITDLTCFPNGVDWEIIGDALGCEIDTGGGVKAGFVKGWITVRAKSKPDLDGTPRPSRFADGQLELKDCDCSGPNCSKVLVSSVNVQISLGGANFGAAAGNLQIKEAAPSAQLADPITLHFVGLAAPVEKISVASGDTQYKAPHCLAWVNAATNYVYRISLYKTSQVALARSQNYGPYALETGAQPFDKWTISNPNGAVGNNFLRVVEDRDGMSITSDFGYVDGGWNLTNGTRVERRVTVDSGTDNKTHTETYTITNANVLIYRDVRIFQDFAWGKELTNEVVGTGPTALTNRWIFYDSQLNDGNNYKHLKMTISPNGHWEKYEYDAPGRTTRIISQFKNNDSTTADDINRVTTITYHDLPRREDRVTKLKTTGNAVILSHSFRVAPVPDKLDADELVREVVCTNIVETTDWNTPNVNNLSRNTWTYRAGHQFEHRIRKIQNEDGTVEVYSYSIDSTKNRLVTIIDRGSTNASSGLVDNGERTFRTNDFAGNLLAEKVVDIPTTTRVLYSRIGSETTADPLDAFGRPQKFTLLDESTEQVSYSCCGAGSFTDRAGVMTTTEYDEFRRVKSTSKANVTTSYDYDATGRLTKTTRTGSGPSAIVLENRHYDDAGRLIDSDDPLRQVTSYSDRVENGYYVKTNKYPNLSTRIESYYQDGSLYRVYGTAVNELKYDYGVDNDGEFTKEIKVRGASESEWVKTYKDRAGRVYMTVYPQNGTQTPASISVFNNLGQLTNSTDPDSVVQLFAYDSRGRLFRSAIDGNGNGRIDPTYTTGGKDRVTEFSYEVTLRDDVRLVRRKTTKVWETVGGAETLLSVPIEVQEVAADERDTWVSNSVQVTQTHIAYTPADHKLEQTETFPDGSKRISVYTYGRLDSVTRYNNVGTADANRIGKTSYTYDGDPYYRLKTTFDQRNGPTTYTYYNDDRISTITTPQPDVSTAAQVTSYQYNDTSAYGHIEIITLPDLTKTTNEFYLTGELKRSSGSRTYPVEYSYEQGRISTMKTWTAGAFSGSGYATTRWNYSPDRGFLTSKTYNDNKGPSYTYSDAGRLRTRVWYRGVTTTYAYTLGDLYTIDYSDNGTGADVTYTYNRRGKPTTIVDPTGTHVIAYDDYGQVDYEDNTSGILFGIKVDHHYDSVLRLRRDYVEVQKSGVAQFKHEYRYDEASRLQKVFSGTSTYAIYGYLADSPLVETVTFKAAGETGTTLFTTTKVYDKLNRLRSISSASPPAAPFSSFTYEYSSANQRTSATFQDSSHWDYQYDKLGQVTTGKRSWSDGTPVAGQQYEYAFDDIGNRTKTRQGGDNYGVNLRTASYTPNLLNQYSSRRVPGYVDVIGTATADSTVTVDDNTSLRKGTYFRAEIPVDNSSAGLSRDVTVRGVKFSLTENKDVLTTAGRTFFVPPAQETFTYDSDGNLTSDGRWDYSWDAENRLTNMTAKAYGLANSARKRLGFNYDYMGRRVLKVVSTWNGTDHVNPLTTRFVYDGWNLLAELDAGNNNAVICAYMWGSDLSGSLQRAGGVGGLIAVSPGLTTTHFVSSDGNGNVTGLTDGSGNISARYEYSPFGETIRASGSAANLNPIRFSTKYTDFESGLCYYGFRFYNTPLGRWLSRDPLAEDDGPNVYAFVSNDSIADFDKDGRQSGPALPPRLPSIPKELTACCDPTSLNEGQTELNRRFDLAKKAAAFLGLSPARPGRKYGPTCKHSSRDVLQLLAPFPKCWQCYLEERDRYPNDVKDEWEDHQAVICVGYEAGSVKKREIMFDWWGDVNFNRSRSGQSPDQFRINYPFSPVANYDLNTFSLTDSCTDKIINPQPKERCFRCSEEKKAP